MSKAVINWAEAYRLYMADVSYEDICLALDIRLKSPNNAYKRIKAYAQKNGLPYPRTPPKKYAYYLCLNGMSTNDIARLLSVCHSTIVYWITDYAKENGLFSPCARDKRAELAYRLREDKKYTYKVIAKLVGYHHTDNCIRAVKTYRQKLAKG